MRLKPNSTTLAFRCNSPFEGRLAAATSG